VLVKELKRDLKAREVALSEAIMKNVQPQVHQALQDELDQLKDHLAQVQVERLGEVEELVNLVTRMSGPGTRVVHPRVATVCSGCALSSGDHAPTNA
jgi:flagellar motor switch protein FliG